MALKLFLTEIAKSKIDILKKNSLLNVKIAKEVGRSEHAARNYLTLDAKYGVKSKTTGNQSYSKHYSSGNSKKDVIQSNKS